MKAISNYVTGLGYTKNTGTVTSVRVQAGTGLSSSVSTAQTGTLNTTISIASGYKLPTTTEWNALATSEMVSAVDTLTLEATTGTTTHSLTHGGKYKLTSGSNSITFSLPSAGSYTLPTASSSTKGGIKVGAGLSMSSETMSVSYGTTSTTAAAGNDSRFGKVGVSEAEYRADDASPAISYYKLGLINSGQNDSNKKNDLSVTSTDIKYNSA